VVCNPAAIDADYTYIMQADANGDGNGYLTGESSVETSFIIQTRDSFDNDL